MVDGDLVRTTTTTRLIAASPGPQAAVVIV
jgi:hypothetical protein